MFNDLASRVFTVSAILVIIACLAGAALSAAKGDWGALPWQFIGAVGFFAALAQAWRASLWEGK